MTPTDREPFNQRADVFRTERFLSVEPLSGYISFHYEDSGFVIYLVADANDLELGAALLQALDRSRFVWPYDEPELFDWQRNHRCYRNWQQQVMRLYGYKSKRELHKRLDWCRVERSQGKITLQPHRRHKPGYFDDLPKERDLVIPETRDAVIVGAALRTALDRCE